MTFDARRSALAVGALAIAFCAQALDVVIVGKFAPVIAASLHQPLPALALLFLASHSGLAAGALLGGAAGDRWGRKLVTIVCLGLAAAVTFVLPLAQSLQVFAVLRGCSGLLLGAAAPCILALVAGICQDRWRPLAITLTLAGASLGSALGSAIAYGFGTSEGWPNGFWICSVGHCVALFLILILVPDLSPPFTIQRQRLQPGILGPWRHVTIVLCTGFLLSMGLNALLSAWLPSFFQAMAGVPIQRFAGIAMYTTPAAAIGMLSTGWLSRRLPMPDLVVLCFGGYALALASLGALQFASAGFIVALAMASCCQAACHALLSLSVVSHYPGHMRATALGATAAAGRTGGILLQGLGALALQTRLPLQSIFMILAVVPIAVGLITWRLERKPSRPA